jgi:hypothetical protein
MGIGRRTNDRCQATPAACQPDFHTDEAISPRRRDNGKLRAAPMTPAGLLRGLAGLRELLVEGGLSFRMQACEKGPWGGAFCRAYGIRARSRRPCASKPWGSPSCLAAIMSFLFTSTLPGLITSTLLRRGPSTSPRMVNPSWPLLGGCGACGPREEPSSGSRRSRSQLMSRKSPEGDALG